MPALACLRRRNRELRTLFVSRASLPLACSTAPGSEEFRETRRKYVPVGLRAPSMARDSLPKLLGTRNSRAVASRGYDYVTTTFNLADRACATQSACAPFGADKSIER